MRHATNAVYLFLSVWLSYSIATRGTTGGLWLWIAIAAALIPTARFANTPALQHLLILSGSVPVGALALLHGLKAEAFAALVVSISSVLMLWRNGSEKR